MTTSLTRDQVRSVDRLALEKYGMSGLVLMENAGRSAAEVIRGAYGDGGRSQGNGERVSIVCGSGNNGGDGFVIARHLHNAGWSVRLICTGAAEKMTPDARANFAIASAMSISVSTCLDAESQADWIRGVEPNDIIVDALLGTGFTGQVRSPISELIRAINDSSTRAVVAIDVPSGLDCDTGIPSRTTVRADITVTFVAEKTCFAPKSALPVVGKVVVVDIGVPRELIEHVRTGGN